MAAAVPLFLAGVWVGWMVMPQVVRALTQFTPTGFSNLIDARDYLMFVTQMVLFLGIAFLVPVVLVGVNMAGIIRGATILKAWRITVFLVFVLAAVAAPGADALSMFLLAGPLLALFFAAIGLCMLQRPAPRPEDGQGCRRDRRHSRRRNARQRSGETVAPSPLGLKYVLHNRAPVAV